MARANRRESRRRALMWTDRILAAVSLLALIAFLGVLITFVKRIDLSVVVVVVIVMAVYDFYRELRA
jgi:hypothetical protein